MEQDELKQLQAPLKEKYKNNPELALVTLKAEGNLGEGLTCNIETGRKIAAAGLHPATGGSGLELCSGDMLLEALTACAGVTFKAVSTAMGIKIKSGKVKAEGELDFRGTLAVSKETLVGFKNIRLSFELETEADEEKISSLIKLTERYCVVYQTLKSSPEMSISLNLK